MTISHKTVDNALNPAWRDASVHFITSESWNDMLPDSVAEQATTNMTNGTGYALRQLAPDSGVYYNEVRLALARFTSYFAVHANTNDKRRQILGSRIGNGHFGDQTTRGFFQSSRSMTRTISCGVTTVWAVSNSCKRIMVRSAVPFDLSHWRHTFNLFLNLRYLTSIPKSRFCTAAGYGSQ